MKRPKDDVWLSDGQTNVVKAAPYGHHLQTSQDVKEVCGILFDQMFFK